MSRNYKNIVAWQRAHEVTLAVYKCTQGFPEVERFGITRQIRRAASSTAANIAEGSGRNTTKEYLRFLYIALGSLKETEYFMLLAHDLGYIPTAYYDRITNSINGTFGALQGLLKAVRKQVGPVGRFQAGLLAILLQVTAGNWAQFC